MSLLGITRDGNRISDLVEKAKSKGIEVVPLPLTSTSFISFEVPDLNNIDWLIFTSQLGVESFFNRLNDSDLTVPNKIKIAVVGNKTEKALERYNRSADFKPSEAYGKILFTEFADKFKNQKLNVLYVRAETVNFEPDHIFENSLTIFNSLITYSTKSNKVDNELIKKFSCDDYIFFTAPSAVDSFNDQFGKPKSKIIAIGNSTAEKMIDKNWNKVTIMKNPDIDTILEYV